LLLPDAREEHRCLARAKNMLQQLCAAALCKILYLGRSHASASGDLRIVLKRCFQISSSKYLSCCAAVDHLCVGTSAFVLLYCLGGRSCTIGSLSASDICGTVIEPQYLFLPIYDAITLMADKQEIL